MNNVYKLLEENIELFLKDDTKNYQQLAICFNRLSDGFVENSMVSNR